MNKLQWFTHDNDAHQDLEMRSLFIGAGGFLLGYGLWWLLIEVLDRHGKGDTVSIKWAELGHIACTKPSRFKPAYCRLRDAGKLFEVHNDSESVTYGIKKFRERQSKMKSKIRSTLQQDSSNLPLEERRGEEKREEERRGEGTATTPSFPSSSPPPNNGPLFCRYSDRGQGQCNERVATDSKYCPEHKIKVHELYLMQQEKTQRSDFNGHSPGYVPPFESKKSMSRQCISCDNQIPVDMKRCDSCQEKLEARK